MQILRNRKELDHLLTRIRKKDLQVGLIPTMGSIHEGHLSLVKKSTQNKFFSLATIYINPTQFNDREDYLNYPREEEKDIEKLSAVNCDALYFPTQEEMYPKGLKSKKTVDEFRNILCDKFRPDHFDGVTTVVESLLRITNPDHAFFGEKDFQQLKIIQSLCQRLKFNIVIHACPSVRLQNYMSLSSRFNNFSANDRKVFDKCAYQIGLLITKLKKDINAISLADFKSILQQKGVKKIDYIEIRDEENLLFSNTCNKSRLFIAMYVGDVRVIDNFILY
jgi:pantoate--beta-alanine ligase